MILVSQPGCEKCEDTLLKYSHLSLLEDTLLLPRKHLLYPDTLYKIDAYKLSCGETWLYGYELSHSHEMTMSTGISTEAMIATSWELLEDTGEPQSRS